MISNEIRETLQRVCSILNKHHVDYMIVGGVAVGYYGYIRISAIASQRPEMKTDLDFWYKPTTENFINLCRSLEELGVSKESLDVIIFDPRKTFLKIPHRHFHTDFLPEMKGLVSYNDSKKNATRLELDGNELYIIGYNDLLLNKKAVSREIDSSDITELEKRNKKKP
jgi:hypothetical protein